MDLAERISGLMPQVREELTELVAMQSVADPRRFPPEECHRAAQWVRDKFAQHGFTEDRDASIGMAMWLGRGGPRSRASPPT